MFKQSMLLLMFVLGITAISQASIVKYEKGIGWISNRDLTSAQFAEKFKQYKDDYLMIDIDVYKSGSSTRYAMVWRKNTENRGWAEYRDMTSDQYHARWNEFKDKGYRPIDIESYRVSGKQRYAGIWVQNKEGYAWSSRRDMTASAYSDYFKDRRDKGYRIVDMEAYSTANGTRYACIWVKNKENLAWKQLRDMSRQTYQKEVNEMSDKGYLLVDFESYKVGSATRYAAIWEKRSGYAFQIRTNRTKLQFANLWREYRDKGYRLVDFECYPTSNGTRYGGVWIENASRFRYSKKSNINSLVSKYRKDNNLPGISVAVVKDGKMIYRRGFGHADKEADKVAHGESVYLSASISKAISGTIAAKLQQRQRTQNGRRISFDINRKTKDYLTNVRLSNGQRVSIPRQHDHKVSELFSHLACIQHYEGPEPNTQHYSRAIDAVRQIWNAPFVDDCDTGVNQNYSTHAFTYIGAVLEKVTGQSSAQLVRSEIARPHGLSTMRALYTNARVPSNYDRVVPYRDNNAPTSFSNNSWKTFGGGIEVSPVDLAWFGWKVLDGKIVSASTRDNLLWKRVNPSRSYGIAWQMSTVNGKRVAQHSGSWTGTQTHLRVFRDDGLVIAIMSNRRNHDIGSLSALSRNIANVVL